MLYPDCLDRRRFNRNRFNCRDNDRVLLYFQLSFLVHLYLGYLIPYWQPKVPGGQTTGCGVVVCLPGFSIGLGWLAAGT